VEKLQPSHIWKRWKAVFSHAFALSPHQEAWSPEELALMERVASQLVQRGMATPTILFLESMGPLSFLGSQALYALSPILGLVCNPTELERMRWLQEDSTSELDRTVEFGPGLVSAGRSGFGWGAPPSKGCSMRQDEMRTAATPRITALTPRVDSPVAARHHRTG